MIHTYIPYCPKDLEGGKDLGLAYNKFMEIVPDDDWVCFLDHDATWTTRDWYHQLEEIIERNPDVGLLTTVTNRIGNPHQLITKFLDRDNHDIYRHREVGKKLQQSLRHHLVDVTDGQLISGVVLLLKKSTWKKVGGFKDGFLSVDNDMHSKVKNAGMKVCIMSGVYVYHWYRGDGDLSHIGK
jgi:GT2 family glycosyltransferase